VSALACPAQNEGPILKPKLKPKPATPSATLLVMCDLACNWKLDGEAKGHIEAGGSAKTKVELGQHVVFAATEDGLDKVQQLSEVKSSGQTVAIIELKPIQDARFKAEQEARDKAAQEARDKADQEARERAAQEARDKAAHEQQERGREEREDAARGTWTDPATGLMWTKNDNGNDVNWQEASNYCNSLRLAGYSDWQLPRIDQLETIYAPDATANRDRLAWASRVKGNLQLTGWIWSSSTGDNSEEALAFLTSTGSGGAPVRVSVRRGNKNIQRALCVRRSEQ
jgi:hypothetical protein